MSCAPQNYPEENKAPVPNVVNNNETATHDVNSINTIYKKTNPQYIENLNFAENKILNAIEILLPEIDNQNITRDFVNAFELSIYKKMCKIFNSI
jgi:tRNA 2-selenouridine synthase SelU